MLINSRQIGFVYIFKLTTAFPVNAIFVAVILLIIVECNLKRMLFIAYFTQCCHSWLNLFTLEKPHICGLLSFVVNLSHELIVRSSHEKTSSCAAVCLERVRNEKNDAFMRRRICNVTLLKVHRAA